MIFLIALVVAGLGAWLAMHSAVPLWLPWLVPVVFALIGYLLWRGEVDENRDLARAEVIIIEIAVVASILGGLAYRRWRAGPGAQDR
jgi:hypothetical protein